MGWMREGDLCAIWFNENKYTVLIFQMSRSYHYWFCSDPAHYVVDDNLLLEMGSLVLCMVKLGKGLVVVNHPLESEIECIVWWNIISLCTCIAKWFKIVIIFKCQHNLKVYSEVNIPQGLKTTKCNFELAGDDYNFHSWYNQKMLWYV